MTTYRSKVDIGLVAIVIAPFSFALYETIKNEDYEMLLIILPILFLVISLYWQIKYVVDKDQFIVRSGIFGTTRVAISDIKSVHKAYNPLSAPALSINRLEVKYGSKFDYLLISPKNRKAFVKQLIAINPNIDVKL